MAKRANIPANGGKTPEYAAVQRSSRVIEAAIDAMSDDFLTEAHGSGLIPSRTPRNPVMNVVLAEISRDPINYYILLYVLDALNVGERFNKSISEMNKTYLGKESSS